MLSTTFTQVFTRTSSSTPAGIYTLCTMSPQVVHRVPASLSLYTLAVIWCVLRENDCPATSHCKNRIHRTWVASVPQVPSATCYVHSCHSSMGNPVSHDMEAHCCAVNRAQQTGITTALSNNADDCVCQSQAPCTARCCMNMHVIWGADASLNLSDRRVNKQEEVLIAS